MLDEYGFRKPDIDQLVRATERPNLSFTASDLVDKIVVRALRRAVHSNVKLTADLLMKTITETEPSPEFVE